MAKNQDTPNRSHMPLPPPGSPPEPAKVQNKEQHPSMAAAMEPGEEAFTKAPMGANGKVDPAPRIGDSQGFGESQMTQDQARIGDKKAPQQDGSGESMLGRIVDAARVMFQTPTQPQSGEATPVPKNLSSMRINQPTTGIEVVALRAGYYKMARKSAGDKFFVENEQELGTWMALTDEKAEQQRRANMPSGSGRFARAARTLAGK